MGRKNKGNKKRHRLRRMVLMIGVGAAVAAWRERKLAENSGGTGPR